MSDQAKLKFGVSPWVWAELIGTDDVGLVERAHALGFDGMEVAVLSRDAFDVAGVKAALQRHGMTPVVSTTLPGDCDLIHPDPACHENGQAFLRHCVDVAVQLGADCVAGPICEAPGRLRLRDAAQCRREFDLAVKNLRRAAAYAADRGVRLALELINRYESCLANTVDQGLRLVEAVESPAFGLHLDTFHMHLEEKSVGAALRRAGKHLFHLHAIENDRGTPGSGSVDWAGVADALRGIGYGGWVVIEGFSTQVDWLTRAVCLWRPLAPDTSRIASDGLAFLKGLMRARGVG